VIASEITLNKRYSLRARDLRINLQRKEIIIVMMMMMIIMIHVLKGKLL
jgi:hypothetical protein